MGCQQANMLDPEDLELGVEAPTWTWTTGLAAWLCCVALDKLLKLCAKALRWG